MMPMTIIPPITVAVASDIDALVIITPRPALAPIYSAATTAIQPIAAAALAPLAMPGAAARRWTLSAMAAGPMPSMVPTRVSVGSTVVIERAVVTTMTKKTA